MDQTTPHRTTWPVGCQVMPWFQARGLDMGMNDEGRASLPGILDQVAAAGFVGFEVVGASVPVDTPDTFVHTMATLELRFAGAHIGEPWWRPDARASIRANVDAVARLKALGCERVIVSNFPFMPADADAVMIRQAADHLQELGRACRDECGLPVAFHNHAPEIANNAACIEAIVERCDPGAMELAPDLGWVAIGGIEPVEFIDRFGARITYVHARDVSESGPNGRTLETGQGVIDYSGVIAALERQAFNGWLIAESEFGPSWGGHDDPDQSARLHFAGLKRSLGPASSSYPYRRSL